MGTDIKSDITQIQWIVKPFQLVVIALINAVCNRSFIFALIQVNKTLEIF